MGSLRDRLNRLEAKVCALSGRVITISADAHMSEQELDAFLCERGIGRASEDKTIIFITVYEDGPAECRVPQPPQLLAVTNAKTIRNNQHG